jgi:phosphoribosyl 1,2-cyclic phosphate phosphodiesterase
MTYRLTFLGSGSSGGVPRVAGGWGACDPKNPKNRRRRCAVLIEKIGTKGITTILIDTPPDVREGSSHTTTRTTRMASMTSEALR